MARSIAEAGRCCLCAASRNGDAETLPAGRVADACLGHVLLLQPGGKEANFRLREHASSWTCTRPCLLLGCCRLRLGHFPQCLEKECSADKLCYLRATVVCVHLTKPL